MYHHPVARRPRAELQSWRKPSFNVLHRNHQWVACTSNTNGYAEATGPRNPCGRRDHTATCAPPLLRRDPRSICSTGYSRDQTTWIHCCGCPRIERRRRDSPPTNPPPAERERPAPHSTPQGVQLAFAWPPCGALLRVPCTLRSDQSLQWRTLLRTRRTKLRLLQNLTRKLRPQLASPRMYPMKLWPWMLAEPQPPQLLLLLLLPRRQDPPQTVLQIRPPQTLTRQLQLLQMGARKIQLQLRVRMVRLQKGRKHRR